MNTIEHMKEPPRWRLPGCGDGCVEKRVLVIGERFTQRAVLHDPASHEEYGACQAPSARTEIRTGPLTYERASRRVFVDGAEVFLSMIEDRLLATLAMRLGRLVAHADLLREVWGPEYAPEPGRGSAANENHLLRVAFSRLRARLGPAGALIKNRPGIGYQLVEVRPADEPGQRWVLMVEGGADGR